MSDPEKVERLAEKMAEALDNGFDRSDEESLRPYAELLVEARDVAREAFDALKRANSLRNGGFNEAIAPRRGKDSTGVTAAQYARANDEREAANMQAKDSLRALLSKLEAL